jgi:hypothetical protein
MQQSHSSLTFSSTDVGVVLTVGRFLRLSLTGQYTRIMFEDMNEVDELRSFCKV